MDRRESKIPRPQLGLPLQAKDNNAFTIGAAPVNARGGKRKADGLDAIPEANKRVNAKPVQPNPATSSATVPSAVFSQSEVAKPGQAPGEETFEDISARTGSTVNDILSRRMQFKKGLKPEKKVEEIVPMVKDLRAVGWYLQASKERSDLDAEQWKAHSEQLEKELAGERAVWLRKQDEIGLQLKTIKDLLKAAEENGEKLGNELSASKAIVSEQATLLQSLQRQLAETEDKLSRTCKELAEKEARIKEIEGVMQNSQNYSSTIQSYNMTLQADLNTEKSKREAVTVLKDQLQGQVAELTGRVKSLEDRRQFDQSQVGKLREEHSISSRDLSALRADLDSTRLERDRLLNENTKVKEEYERIKRLGGESIETLEMLTNDKATLEVQLSTQQRMIASMREDLGMSKEQQAMAESMTDSQGKQLLDLKSQVLALGASLEAAEKRAYDGELIRRKLHNTIQELKGNIRVFCRVRPVNSVEQIQESDLAMSAMEMPPSDDPLSSSIHLSAPDRRGDMQVLSKHSFSFDRVFSPDSSQESVFEEISELVQSALDGHRVCIFAYGQTGSGKTFTMLGNEENPGMIPRAMRQIFSTSQRLEMQGWNFTMQASMLEIYNEEYKDLLAKRPKGATHESKKYQVLHSADGVTTVSDLTVADISDPSKVDALLQEAMDKRSVGCTSLNEQSSRSHMVFTMKIDGVNEGSGKKVTGVLNLIDLAGSERVKDSGATGIRLKEAQSINTSLSALGDVIVALSNKQQHIPFRNSKLTYLLQPCLGGDAKTLMFVNVAPTMQFAGESLCSLRFAAKVNACEINKTKK